MALLFFPSRTATGAVVTRRRSRHSRLHTSPSLSLRYQVLPQPPLVSSSLLAAFSCVRLASSSALHQPPLNTFSTTPCTARRHYSMSQRWSAPFRDNQENRRATPQHHRRHHDGDANANPRYRERSNSEGDTTTASMKANTPTSTTPLPRSRAKSSSRRRSGGDGGDVQLQARMMEQQQHAGIFQSQHIKPFPVRAAIDIGTGGVMSLCVARVDAQVGAIQKLMYQTQLPLHLERLQRRSPSHASQGVYKNHNNNNDEEDSFALSERTMDDIRNKMRVLHGVMRRSAFEGLSERAAVVSWPLCRAVNATQLARELTREFKVDVRVLGQTFNVEWPPSVTWLEEEEGTTSKRDHDQPASTQPRQTPRSLKELLHRTSTTTTTTTTGDNVSAADHHRGDSLDTAMGQKEEAHTQVDRPTDGSRSAHPSAQSQVDTLAFLAHAAVSQCVAPQRLLVLSEDPQRGMRLLGLGTTPQQDVADLLAAAESPEEKHRLQSIALGTHASPTDSSRGSTQRSIKGSRDDAQRVTHGETDSFSSLLPLDHSSRGLSLVQHLLPVDVASAHRHCITDIQGRSAASYGLHTSSPNPLLADEFAALRGLLVERVRHDLPSWVRRKAMLGGMLAATSHNGGVVNIAARVAQQTHVSLEHLEVHAQHHFCGLTDVMLAETFPNPLLVLPSAALFAALLRAVESPRLVYLPEVNAAAALVVQPALWLASRTAEVRSRLGRDPFYAKLTREQKGRVFERPHRKDNPTAAPDATWSHGGKLNPLSYQESMKGT